MNTKKHIVLCAGAGIGLIVLAGCVTDNLGFLQPSAGVVSSGGPDIQEAVLEPYDGKKARLAVSRFRVSAARAQYRLVGEGLADMLSDALFQTNRYITLERQALSDVIAEQDLGASGRVKKETAAALGEIEGAELLVMGSVTEFEPGTAGAGASVGHLGYGSSIFGMFSAIAGSIRTSHIAITLRLVDAKTSRIVAATTVEGKATDIAGLTRLAGGGLGIGLSGFANTPMEKATRIAIKKAVAFVVERTPDVFYRHAAPAY